MSIILALISSRDGIVASDSRRFNSLNIVNGVATEPVRVAKDPFNKTFSLDNGKIVGAFCGLLEFAGYSVADQIIDITSKSFYSGATFLETVARIEKEIINRLNEIDHAEVIPLARNLDLLLVAGANLTRTNMKIVSIRFKGAVDGVQASREVVSVGKGIQYYLYGDDKAIAAARGFLNTNHASTRDATFLRKLAMKAIGYGIKNCGTHPYGSEQACSGPIYTSSTRY